MVILGVRGIALAGEPENNILSRYDTKQASHHSSSVLLAPPEKSSDAFPPLAVVLALPLCWPLALSFTDRVVM
jgi:hypothetical protein